MTRYCTRASEQGPNAGQWDNGPVMERRFWRLRHELAQLLGFAMITPNTRWRPKWPIRRIKYWRFSTIWPAAPGRKRNGN
jgi:hypothetical protein